jgi:hypothetical protein
MRRGKNQLVFRYLPEMLVDYHHGRTIARISNWISRKAEKVNERRILREVEKYVFKFQNRPGYPGRGAWEEYVVLDPRDVEVELFPLTFTCQRCQKAYSFPDYKTLRGKTNGTFRCTRKTGNEACGGYLKQEHFIFLHKCGFLGQLEVPSCKRHGTKYVKLDKRGSIVSRNFRWVCGICGEELGPVAAFCPTCRERIHSPTVFRKNTVYYPQYVRLVNVPTNEIEILYENEQYCLLPLAVRLGLMTFSDLEGRITGQNASGRGPDYANLIKELEEEGLDIDKRTIELVKKKLKIQDTSNYDDLEVLRNELSLHLTLEAIDLTEVGVSLFDYYTLINHEGAKSVSDVVREAEEDDSPIVGRTRLFEEKLRIFGIQNAWVMDGLPVVIAAYGFTRGGYDPKKDFTLNHLTFDSNYPERIPVYVHRTETEAIILELDSSRVLRWLDANGIAGVPKGKSSGESQAAWLLTNVHAEEIPVFASIEDNTTVTWFVYNLLHTMSHSLIRNASVIAGFDTGSMGEMIFPSIPAMVLYSNNQTSFQIGGLHTLFETSVYPWIDKTIEDVQSCLYDPICFETDGSCHACLQLSEITCEHFNRDLDRAILVGCERDDGTNIKGFLEVT